MFFYFLLFAQNQPIYFYFNDGGEHNYLEKCQKWTGTEKEWKEIKTKLSDPNSKKGLLGKIFSEGELTSTTEYYFTDENHCNLSLKESSKWFKKEFEKTKPPKNKN
ncbi:hypothetical protein K2X05_04350 [bacterium]|nr:hypothetical protein [bacterium]